MFYFLIVLILIVALLMALVVLLQSGKGGGLAGIASGGQTTQILGARQAPDFLEKATWTLGWSFLALCVMTTFFIPRAGGGGSILQDRADDLPAGAPAPIEAPINGGLEGPAEAGDLPTANPSTPTAPDVAPTQ